MGLSTEKNALRAAEKAAMQAKYHTQANKIDLCLVFTTVDLAQPIMLDVIKKMFPEVPLIGCSSLGIITENQVYKHAVAILLISLPQGAYLNTGYVQGINSKSAVEAGEEFGDKLMYGFKNIPRDFGIMFSDGLLKENSSFLSGLQEKLGRSFPIIGACASDNLKFVKTYLYMDKNIFSGGACGAMWGGKLHFGFGIRHGWKPLGKPHYVTGATGNIIHTIDGLPAAFLYKEYLSADLPALRKELKRISALYPLGFYLSGEEEYLLRNIVSINDAEALICQGNIPQGSAVRLMIGTKESCLDATRRAAEDVKKNLRGKPCNFLLVFESTSRYTLLGRRIGEELRIIKEVLGENLPLLGIYTYGEQAPLTAIGYHGTPYFHNQSISILGIGN